MCFIKGVADEEIAFLPLSAVFCAFVQEQYLVYCNFRTEGELNRFEYTVTLFRVWSQRRAKHDLDAKQESLSKALNKATKEAARVPPIGV
jgi:hypothetical protein